MGVNRWIAYQRERFPVLGHGLLIAAFSSSTIAFSHLLRGDHHPLGALVLLAGFLSSFLFFLQLRIADEHKDADEDARFRPYRPVPRGLVRLQELAAMGIGAAFVQLGFALFVDVRLVPLLLVVWAFLFVMSREFFAGAWLRRHPVAYMLSHMAIMPLIDLYISAFDWIGSSGPPHALGAFVCATFLSGIVVEIGRKIRAPRDEELGVETYSALWGPRGATYVWCAAVVAATGCAVLATIPLGAAHASLLILAGVTLAAILIGARFLRSVESLRALRIEQFSAFWTVVVYATMGLLPLALRGAH